ncbi:hypothetical protein Dsin_032065 [Dipteronia sinensis]|uniref:Retrotransposon gag domain-containing protein n=1 Tax=Dipteronia sinensis TaxID=43782 RepID=A0AAD9ZP00_9ROSI|nr:hypothetical protein Dsin_032065 [Dipteronia sinensis]
MQSGCIHNYIKEFSTLILEIEDMFDKDKLFFFIDGLKEWARVNQERRNVQDLDAAITAAESLVDLTKARKGQTTIRKIGVDESKDQDRKTEGPSRTSNGNNWA